MLIFIGNMCSDDNKGDLAIIEATHDILKGYFPDAEIVIQNVDYSLPSLEKKRLNRWSRGLAARYHGSFFPKIGDREGPWFSRIVSVLTDSLLSMYFLILALLVRVTRRPFLPLVPAKHRQAWQDLFHSDLVVGKGGCYLLSNIYSPLKDTLFLYRMSYIFLLARMLGKKIIFLGHSIGPVKGFVRSGLVKLALKGAYAVVVREVLSKKYVKEELGIESKRVFLCPDLAFWFTGKPMERLTSTVSLISRVGKGVTCVGLTVREWSFPETGKGNMFLKQYVGNMAAFIQTFLDRHPDCLFILLPQCLDDIRISQRIIRIVGSTRVIMVENDLSTDELRFLMSKLDCLVGTRIHSNILALTVGTPVIPVIYQMHKGIGIMKMAKVPEQDFFFIQQLDPESLAQTVERILFETAEPELRRVKVLETTWKLKDKINENLGRLLR